MTAKEYMEMVGRDRLLLHLTELFLTAYIIDPETSLCRGSVIPDKPMTYGTKIWESEGYEVTFNRLDDDARMWVETIDWHSGKIIPMECKYNLFDRIFRFMEEGASYRSGQDKLFFSGCNTISFSFRKED